MLWWCVADLDPGIDIVDVDDESDPGDCKVQACIRGIAAIFNRRCSLPVKAFLDEVTVTGEQEDLYNWAVSRQDVITRHKNTYKRSCVVHNVLVAS